MLLAHVSDPHVLSPVGVALNALAGKRLTGATRLRFKRRGRVYRREHVAAVLREAARLADHVVLTGDITNLALPDEFERAVALLAETGLGPDRLTVVPGNHDVYTVGSMHARRHLGFFGPWQQGDLPGLGVELPCGTFPFVRLRGPAALIGLSTALARPVFVAGGALGTAQLEALSAVLEHPEVRCRTPVFLLHHPPFRPLSRLRNYLDGLADGEALLRLLRPLRRAILLHGHLHLRSWCTLPTAAGALEQLGATSAALEHPDPVNRAAVNLYQLDGDGQLSGAFSQVIEKRADGDPPAFFRAELPRVGRPG